MMSGLSLSAWAHTTPHEFQTKSCHSTQRKITLLFNYVGPHSASQFPFFNYVRSQRIRWTRWSHKPTQRINIFLLESREPVAYTERNNSPHQSREPTQHITIAFFLLPTQERTILLFQTRELIQRITITFFLLPTHYPFFCCPHGAKRSSSSKHLSPHCASRFIFFRYPPRS